VYYWGFTMGASIDRHKKGAYYGYVFALLGGLLVGFGVAAIFVTRTLINQVISVDSSLSVNFESYGNIQLMGMFIILVGVVSAILGLYTISRNHRMETPPPTDLKSPTFFVG
jgi:uncharacterized membrane protein YdbT with pleckstrin-like domain